ncbi:hypothetical protein GCM10010106_45900 [Thermopolyspora flexuosa]|jgi:hypothetical protein|nr:hypothetical protein GCM10010106_45900 [Thermopolyspora flexuosa]
MTEVRPFDRPYRSDGPRAQGFIFDAAHPRARRYVTECSPHGVLGNRAFRSAAGDARQLLKARGMETQAL